MIPEVKVAGRDIAVNRDFELDVTFQNVAFVVKRLSSFFIEILTKEDNMVEKLKVI